MMMGHQRDILATMGIDVWVPRHVARVQQSDIASLWRDQDLSHEVIDQLLILPKPSLEQAQPASLEIAEAILEPVATLEKNKTEIQDEPSFSLKKAESEPAIEISAFELQAISLASCVIVVDASNLNAEQAELWLNIQCALPMKYHALKWPFPLAEMQDGRGAVSYVDGFLDALSVDKDLIALGDIPHLQQAEVQHLASLQQMLAQPILKKRLWQFMQKSVNTRINDE